MRHRKGAGGTIQNRCVFDQDRYAPARGCQCPNCVYRRNYKKLAQRAFYKRHGWNHAYYAQRRMDPAFRLHNGLYTALRKLMIEDGAWPFRER